VRNNTHCGFNAQIMLVEVKHVSSVLIGHNKCFKKKKSYDSPEPLVQVLLKVNLKRNKDSNTLQEVVREDALLHDVNGRVLVPKSDILADYKEMLALITLRKELFLGCRMKFREMAEPLLSPKLFESSSYSQFFNQLKLNLSYVGQFTFFSFS